MNILEKQVGHGAAKDRLLAESHASLQRVLVRIATPLLLAAYSITAIRTGFAWQAVGVLLAAVGAAVIWRRGLMQSREGKLSRSGDSMLIGLQLLLTVTVFLTRGNGATALAGQFIAILYASMFSRRHLMIASAIAALAYLGSETAWHFRLYQPLVLSENEAFYRSIVFFAVVLPSFVYICLSASRMHARLLAQTEALNDEQRTMLVSAKKMGVTLDDAIQRIDSVATAFSRQAGEQSAAIAEIGQTMGQIRELASRSAQTASATHAAVVELSDTVGPGTNRLRAVEAGFEVVLQSNQKVRRQFEELTTLAERVGGILELNREIAAQIKILAVNANVQAAKAGAYGAGFRVVATELKGMIQRTESALGESRRLLEAIMERARNSASAIDTSTAQLERHHQELGETTVLIEDLLKRFISTADGVRGLSAAAYEQQYRLDEVSGNIAYIERAAVQLAASTKDLSATVHGIDEAQTALINLLGSRAD